MKFHCPNCHHPDDGMLLMSDGYFTCTGCGHHIPCPSAEQVMTARRDHPDLDPKGEAMHGSERALHKIAVALYS